MLKKIKERNNYDLIALFVATIIFIIVFSLSKRGLFSDYRILLSDLYAQYIPLYRMFFTKIFENNDIFGAGSLFYSMSAGYGLDVSPYITKEDLFSPFNIVFLFISDNNLAAYILILSKLSFSAFFFQRYCRRVHNVDGLQSVCWSVAYAFCGYCTLFFHNVQYLEGVVLLPIIVTLCYELVYKNDSGVKLTILYFLSFINSFYSGYLVGIFSFLFFVLTLLMSGKDNKIRIFLIYIRTVIIAILLSSFLIVPTAYSIFTTMASDATQFEGNLASIKDFICNFFIGMNQGYNGTIPYVYSGIAAILLIPLFFINKEIVKKSKIIWGTLLFVFTLACFIPQLYLALHGFDNPDMFLYRFAYLISFILLSIACISYNKIQSSNKIHIVVIAFCVICFCSFIYYLRLANINSSFVYYVNIIFVVIYLTILVVNFKGQIKKYIFISAVLIEAMLNFYMILINLPYGLSIYKPIVNMIEEDIDSSIEGIKTVDNGYYRVFIPNVPSADYHMLHNIMRGQFFGSCENADVRNTIYHLGMMTSPRVLTDYGITNGTMMILGYKYSILNNGAVVNQDINSPIINENDYFLGMGYMTNSEIQKLEFDNYVNPFENINSVLSAMTGKRIEYFVNKPLETSCIENNIVCEELENGLLFYYVSEGDEVGTYMWIFDASEDYYAYIPSLYKPQYLDVAPIEYSIGGDQRVFMFGQFAYSPQIIKLGKENDSYNLNLQINANSELNTFYIKDIFFYYEDKNQLQLAYDDLSQGRVYINQLADGYISGKCYAYNDKDTVFLSIAYDKNWKLLVDGKEEEIIPALNKSFISFNVEPGEHQFILKYINPSLKYGFSLSIIGVLMFCAIIIVDIKKKKSKK